MPRKQISLLVPEPYDEGMKKLRTIYGSRNNVAVIAVKRLLQYEARVGHLQDETVLRLILPEKR